MKISIILGVIILLAVGVFFLFSKPASEVSEQVTPQPTSLQPKAGKTITINDCKAEPQILQTSQDAEITFVNTDQELHVLSFYNPITQGTETIEIMAGGSLKTTKLSQGKNFTNNFSCDNKTIPYGGAVYVTP